MKTPSLNAANSSGRPSVYRWWADWIVALMIAAFLWAVYEMALQWLHPLNNAVEINLSAWALPQYAFYSLARGLVAFVFSLIFTLLIASWAYSSQAVGRVILPILDILQSIPVLGFLPGLVLCLVHLFPHNNIGLELACVLMIFTGQVWNLAFSFYDSLRGVPSDYRDVGKLAGFGGWQRFRQIELPYGTTGLIYNGMMSMAGGWFFLTINEAFTLGDQSFRLPGLGSYMAVAHEKGDSAAQGYAVVAMILVIIAVDQLLWRPLVVWAARYKIEDISSGPVDQCWLLEIFSRSRGLALVLGSLNKLSRSKKSFRATSPETESQLPLRLNQLAAVVAALGLIFLAVYLLRLLLQMNPKDWSHVAVGTGCTFLRVMTAVLIGTLWTVPIGIWIGMNPKISKYLQPVTQVAASFPAPMLFPIIVALLIPWGASFEWVSMLLIMFGTQWYILFNVMSGARGIPADLVACTRVLRLGSVSTWKTLYLPSILPALVTGWITATGGAWNASIVAEYLTADGKQYTATGLGSVISEATDKGNFGLLTAAVLTMVVVVVGWNILVWKPLGRLADSRYRLTN